MMAIATTWPCEELILMECERLMRKKGSMQRAALYHGSVFTPGRQVAILSAQYFNKLINLILMIEHSLPLHEVYGA